MKKFIILAIMAMFPSLAHSAGQIEISNPPNANGQALTPNTVTANSVSAATVTALENGATFGAFPATPMFFACNTNGYCQHVGQNLSNGTGASGDVVLTNDLGGDTSFYINIGINSSKFSQAAQTLSLSSAGYLTTSDGGLVIQAGLNGNNNGATYNGRNSPYIQIVSSVSNVMADISTTAWTIPSNSTFSIAGNAFSVGGSSLQVNGGIITGSTQPFNSVYATNAYNFIASTPMPVFWNRSLETRDNMWSTVGDSSTVTIPANGSGLYDLRCQIAFANGGAAQRVITYIVKNGDCTIGTDIAEAERDRTGAILSQDEVQASKTVRLSAGDVLRCCGEVTVAATAINTDVDERNFFTATKMW